MRPRKKVVLYFRNEEEQLDLQFVLTTRLPVVLYRCRSLEEVREHFSGEHKSSTDLLIFNTDTGFHLNDLGLDGVIPAIEIGVDNPSNYHTSNFYISNREEDWIRLLLATYKVAVQKKRGPKKRMGPSLPRLRKERTRRFPETMKVSPILNGQSLHQGLGTAP